MSYLEVKGKRVLQNKYHHGKDETACPPMDGRNPTECSISATFLNLINNTSNITRKLRVKQRSISSDILSFSL